MSMALAIACLGGCSNNESRELSQPDPEFGGGAQQVPHEENPELRSGGARSVPHIEDADQRSGGARSVPHAGDEDEAYRGGEARQQEYQDQQVQQQQQQQEQQLQQQTQRGPLDGKTFAVTVSDPSKGAVPDDLIFQNGMLDSTACRQYGFAPARYEARSMADGTVHFTSETRSGDVTILWDGTITEDKISGSAISRTPGKAPVHMSFEGTPKQ